MVPGFLRNCFTLTLIRFSLAHTCSSGRRSADTAGADTPSLLIPLKDHSRELRNSRLCSFPKCWERHGEPRKCSHGEPIRFLPPNKV
jgi:hypothetical protein